MQVIINQDILIAEDVRLVKRLFKVGKDANFPDGLKFAYQYLVFKYGEWLDVCRIDNYRHSRQKAGAHIHKFSGEFVEFRDIGFREAEELVIRIGGQLKVIIGADEDG